MQLREILMMLFLICTFKGIAQDADKFVIFGKIDGIGNTKVLLGNKPSRGYSGAFKVKYFDSCYSKNDSFTFKGQVKGLDFYSIEVPAVAKGWVSFILENEELNITGNKDSVYNSKVTGSSQTNVYNFYWDTIYYPALSKVRKVQAVIDSLKKINDTIEIKQLERDFITPYYANRESTLFRFIEGHPSNYGMLYELWSISNFIKLDTAIKYYSKLTNKLKESALGKKLKYRLFDYPEKTALLKPIPFFSMPDTTQNLRTISEFRGKYVIIDFWASWCGPCLEELPQLKELYNRFHSKGVDLLGISLDTNKKMWTQSIIKNKIPWTNLSDLEGSNNKAAVLLNVNEIPSKFLIDPAGNILLKSASLAEIEKALTNRLLQ